MRGLKGNHSGSQKKKKKRILNIIYSNICVSVFHLTFGASTCLQECLFVCHETPRCVHDSEFWGSYRVDTHTNTHTCCASKQKFVCSSSGFLLCAQRTHTAWKADLMLIQTAVSSPCNLWNKLGLPGSSGPERLAFWKQADKRVNMGHVYKLFNDKGSDERSPR